jgi:hypothetical protein
VSFDLSVDGTTWMALGAGSRISGGWELTGLSLAANGTIRARASTVGGYCGSSSGLVEKQSSFSGLAVPDIAVEQPAGTDLTDNSATISFGNVLPGATSRARIFTIINHGTANLTGLAITIDGTHPDDFVADVLGATDLAPGESTTFTVAFTPAAIGTRSAALHIASNDFDENSFDIALTGRGATDGDAEPNFNPAANADVYCAAMQIDGKILLGVFSPRCEARHAITSRVLMPTARWTPVSIPTLTTMFTAWRCSRTARS